VRRTSLFVIPVLLALAAACSQTSPVAPTGGAAGADLGVKGEKPVNVNGVMGDFSGDESDFSFVVEGTLVRGDALTELYGDTAFWHLADGVRVEVKGVQRAGFVYARRVHVNGPRPDAPGPGGGTTPTCTWAQMNDPEPWSGDPPNTSLQGYLFAVDGVAPDLTLNASGRLVHTDAGTLLTRLGAFLPLTVLRPAIIVTAQGFVQPDTSINAVSLTIDRDTLDVDVEGAIAGLGGTYPDMQFTIDGTPMVTHAYTHYQPGPCEALVEGGAVHVRGVKMPDDVTVLVTGLDVVAASN
jgi:hypothetical protein